MDEQQKSINLEEGSINDVDQDWQIQCYSLRVETSSRNVSGDQTEIPTTSDRMPHDIGEFSLNDLSANHVSGMIQYQGLMPNKTPDLANSKRPNDDNSDFQRQKPFPLQISYMKREPSFFTPRSAEKELAPSISAPLPTSTRRWNHCEKRQASTTISKNQNSLKRTSQTGQLDGDDLCASILLACLFCQPLDCLLASGRGVLACMSSLCSEMCGCETTLLDSLQTVTNYCCGCLDSPCCLCGTLDCSVCDVCLTATECLDLGMEISQMLFH